MDLALIRAYNRALWKMVDGHFFFSTHARHVIDDLLDPEVNIDSYLTRIERHPKTPFEVHLRSTAARLVRESTDDALSRRASS